MMMKMRRLACFAQGREMAELDMDEPERIMTYNGLESCILSSHSYEIESGTSRGDGSRTDSTDEDNSSCSSSKDGFGSFSSHWVTKRVEQQMDEWETSESPRHSSLKDQSGYAPRNSDVDAMKEKFAKLLLGDDVSGGTKGLSTALALSNAITNLAAEVFGEMWKLVPLPKESKIKWKREKDWLLSPANYMVQLVPAKQSGANGATMEIMIPKARMDINMNLPALQKLDSMLIDTLDSMAKTEFWYMEGGTHAEGRASNVEQGRRWWLPSPRVPTAGMSDTERKKLLYQSKMVLQVYKAAKSINENILLEMPVPTVIRDAIPKTGKTNLGEELHKVLNFESSSAEEMLNSLNLKSEHEALETVNRLEGAVLHWKGRIKEQAGGKSPSSWSFMKDPLIELDKMELLMKRAEALLQLLKLAYPNLPQTFLEVTKIQYGKDIGHAILEAYSRALGNLAFKILSRIADVLQEDVLSNPNSPLPESYFQGINVVGGVVGVSQRARQSFIDPMNRVGGRLEDSNACSKSYFEFTSDEGKSSSLASTPSRGSVWCVGREACGRVSCENSP